MDFPHWVNGASCKSQGPPFKNHNMHENPSFEQLARAVQEAPKTCVLLLLSLVAPQSKCLLLKKPCT